MIFEALNILKRDPVEISGNQLNLESPSAGCPEVMKKIQACGSQSGEVKGPSEHGKSLLVMAMRIGPTKIDMIRYPSDIQPKCD